MSQTVYISFPKNVEVNNRSVLIGDAGKIWCDDLHITSKIKAIRLINVPDVKSRRYVYSVMKVIELIKTECENVEVTNVGVPEFIISYKEAKTKNHFIQYIKIAIVAFITFFGGTFAIMAYGNDVGITSIFETICKFIDADTKTSLLVTQIAYSIGLTVGVVIFYNHIGKRSSRKDPTPIEVEMRIYEDEIDTAIINESQRKEKEEDVR